ncbi:unnamed protein product, partial [Amoebophrya sp. A25]
LAPQSLAQTHSCSVAEQPSPSKSLLPHLTSTLVFLKNHLQARVKQAKMTPAETSEEDLRDL